MDQAEADQHTRNQGWKSFLKKMGIKPEHRPQETCGGSEG